jgi:hypothetical protein
MMQLTLVKTVEESITFKADEVKEVAKRIADAIWKPDVSGIIIRDGEKEIMNFEGSHFALIKELIAR